MYLRSTLCNPCDVNYPIYTSNYFNRIKDIQRNRINQLDSILQKRQNNVQKLNMQMHQQTIKRRQTLGLEIDIKNCLSQLKSKEQRLSKLKNRIMELENQIEEEKNRFKDDKRKDEFQYQKIMNQLKMQLYNQCNTGNKNMNNQYSLQYDTMKNEENTLVNILQIMNNENIVLRKKEEEIQNYIRKLKLQNQCLKQSY